MDTSVFTAFDAFDFENNANFQKGWTSVKMLLNSDTDTMQEDYLRAKAFFFSKYIQSFDFERYMAWKSESEHGHLTTNPDRQRFDGKTGEKDILNKTDTFSSAASKEADPFDSECKEERNISDYERKDDLNYKSSPSHFTVQPSTKEVNVQTENEDENKGSNRTASDTHNSHPSQGKDCKSNPSNESENDESLSLTDLAVLLQNGLPIPGLISVDVQPTHKDPTPSNMTRKPKPWELKNSDETVVEEVTYDKNLILDNQP